MLARAGFFSHRRSRLPGCVGTDRSPVCLMPSAKRPCAQHQRPVAPDSAVAAHHEIGPAQLILHFAYFNCLRWSGVALDGRSLVIVLEADHGGLIHFCRYVPLLKSVCSTLICHPALKTLLAMLSGVDCLYALNEVIGAVAASLQRKSGNHMSGDYKY